MDQQGEMFAKKLIQIYFDKTFTDFHTVRLKVPKSDFNKISYSSHLNISRKKPHYITERLKSISPIDCAINDNGLYGLLCSKS